MWEIQSLGAAEEQALVPMQLKFFSCANRRDNEDRREHIADLWHKFGIKYGVNNNDHLTLTGSTYLNITADQAGAPT